jgi:DNA replication protein DnaC
MPKKKPRVLGLTLEYLKLKIKETEPIKKLIACPDNLMKYIWGKRGNGKSIAVQYYLCQESIKNQRLRIKFIELKTIIDQLMIRDPAEQVVYIAGLIKFDILAIDEIDKKKISEFVDDNIFYLLDKRKTNLRDTIIIGNKGPSEVEKKVGESITSRILSGEIIKNDGELLR